MILLSNIREDALYTDLEVQQLLGVTRVTLWRLRQKGYLRYIKREDGANVLYRGKHLLEYLQSCERGGQAA